VSPSPKYDLIAIDVDGTLLDSQHRLPAENRRALHRAHEAGMRVVLCTGRSYPETKPVLDEIGLDLDAAVTVFGAMITDVRSGRTLSRTPMSLPVAYELTDWLLKRGFTTLWLNDAEEAGFDGYVIDGHRRHPAVDRWVQHTPCRVTCVDRLRGDVWPPVRVSIIDDPDVLADVEPELRRTFDGRIAHNLLRAPAYDLTIIETFAPQVNKWFAVEQLCQRWEIDPRRTVAVGDDVNDVDMIREAGWGVAMANAHPSAKSVARQVAGKNDDAGVAGLIDELLSTPGVASC
jgi:hydroxymethylpyrimidine pyrophosphatase-like HAD family hydrolase